MLNRNEDFAEKQTDAFTVMWITELVPLDHEELYSVSRRQSQMRYYTLLRLARVRWWRGGAVRFKLRVSAVNAARISREISHQV